MLNEFNCFRIAQKSFDFVIKTPPAAIQLLSAAKIKKGSPESNRIKVAKVNWDQVKLIAEDKMKDLNAFTIESAMKMVAGTARSMGINITGKFPDSEYKLEISITSGPIVPSCIDRS